MLILDDPDFRIEYVKGRNQPYTVWDRRWNTSDRHSHAWGAARFCHTEGEATAYVTSQRARQDRGILGA